METAIGVYCICREKESWQLGNEGKWDFKGQVEMTKNCNRGEITVVHRLSSRSTERKIKGGEDVGT